MPQHSISSTTKTHIPCICHAIPRWDQLSVRVRLVAEVAASPRGQLSEVLAGPTPRAAAQMDSCRSDADGRNAFKAEGEDDSYLGCEFGLTAQVVLVSLHECNGMARLRSICMGTHESVHEPLV